MGHVPSNRLICRLMAKLNLIKSILLSNATDKSTPPSVIIVILFTMLSIERHLYLCELSQINTVLLRRLQSGFYRSSHNQLWPCPILVSHVKHACGTL